MPGLSFAIITRNAANTLEECLNSLREVADEVVVLDSGSDDQTEHLARAFGAKVYQQAFTSFSEQKNQAAARCTHPWIFSIDADECLSPELRRSLLLWKQEPKVPGVYRVKRLNHIGRKPIRHAGWYPDEKPRLYHREAARWVGGRVHEKLEPFESGPGDLLPGDLYHYPFNTFQEHLQKTERYALLAAEDKSGLPAGKLKFKSIFAPPFKFFKMYFLQMGFLDGRAGWWICAAAYRETRLKYVQALELQKQRS